MCERVFLTSMRRFGLLLLVLLFLELPLFAAMAKETANPRPAGRKLQTQAKLKRVQTRRGHRRSRFRRLVFWSPIKGSRESLRRQNERTAADELERIQDGDHLLELTQSKFLVELPEDGRVMVAGNLPGDRRYCRPWARSFVEDFAQAHYERFGRPLQVTSAVRTVAVQQKLRRRNRNAADSDGELASPHLTGATIDIGKRGMSKAQLKWIRDYLLGQQNSGHIDVAEEFRQKVFHITVYKDYELSRLKEPSPAAAPAPAAETVAPASDTPTGSQ